MSTPETTDQLPVEAQLQPPAPLLAQTKISLVEASTVFLKEAEAHLAKTREKYKGVVWNDIHTVKGMDAIVRARAEFRTFRTQILKNGADALNAPGKAVKELLTDHIRELGEAAKAEEERLDDIIKAEERRKADEKAKREAEERARLAELRLRITAILNTPVRLVGASSDEVLEARDALLALDLNDMQELKDEAELARRNVATTLAGMAAEKMAAEEEAERQRQERARQAEEERRLAEQRAALERQQELARRLQDIVTRPATLAGAASWQLREAVEELEAIDKAEFGDMAAMAEISISTALMALDRMLQVAEQAERAAAEAAEAEAAAKAAERAAAEEASEPLPDVPEAAPPAQDLLVLGDEPEWEVPSHADVIGAIQQDLAGTAAEAADHHLDTLVYTTVSPAAQQRTHFYDDVADQMFRLDTGAPSAAPFTERPTDAQLCEAVASFYLVSEEVAHQWLLSYGAEGKAE